MLCASCAAKNPTDAKFCNACGVRLARSVSTHGLIDGERRHLTVLFSDLVGSTEISARLDPEHWHEIAACYQRNAADVVTQLGGHVGKFLGDGLIAYFGYPDALEDASERAVRAGLAIVQAIKTQDAVDGRRHGVSLAVRVGLHAGSVVVAPAGGIERDMFGDAPNIAARVQAEAAPNSVVVTSFVRDAVAGSFIVQELGARPLKGVVTPMPLFQVVRPVVGRRRAPDQASRKLPLMVGRDEELRVLVERCGRAGAGTGQFALVIGEPGIGKSRLLEELRLAVESQSHLWLECAGEPVFNNTPFHAVTQVLEQGLGWRGDETKAVRRSSLRRALQDGGHASEETYLLLAELLELAAPDDAGLSPLSASQKRSRLLAALSNWVLSTARARLLVIAIEDLHWLDPSTLELVQSLAERTTTAQLLIVATARSEFRPSWPLQAHHTLITLNRLAKQQIREMVSPTINGAGLGEAMVEAVVERADGVPLFAQELSRLMLDGVGRVGVHDIPETLQDSLAARLDRLGPAKETAQLGAVLGREFSYDLLRAVSDLNDDDLRGALATIVEADLVSAIGEPPSAYRFRHALVRDAAYEALLKRQRRALHARVAQTILAEFAALAQARPQIVAHHWSQAHEFKKASACWTTAANAAAERHAYKEAAEALSQALTTSEACPQTPERDERDFQLWRSLVGVSQIAYGYSAIETQDASRNARRLAEKTGNVRKKFALVAGEWMASSSAGDYVTARRLAEELMPLARAHATPEGLATAHMVLMTTRCRMGNLAGAEAAFSDGQSHFTAPEFVRRPGAAAQAFGNAAVNAWIMGDEAEARRRTEPVLRLASMSDNPYELAFAQYMAGMVALMLGDLADAERLSERSKQQSADGRFPQFAATSAIILGRARSERGDAETGLSLMLEGLEAMGSTRSRAGMTMYLTWLAATRAASGAYEKALQTLEQALTINPRERFFRPETLRLRGELHVAAGDQKRAAVDFARAIRLADIMQARLFRQRAVDSLARMQSRP